MSTPFSLRLDEELHRRLAQRRRSGESKSRLAEELIDEGLRMREHPGLVFREGPAGRRAAVLGGPDVWEVIETLKGTGKTGEEAIKAAAEWGELSVQEVRTAVAYYGEHRDEVDGWIEANRTEATRLREAWEQAQETLG